MMIRDKSPQANMMKVVTSSNCFDILSRRGLITVITITHTNAAVVNNVSESEVGTAD